MPTLPTPGGDVGVWDAKLNTWLQTSMNADGTPKSSVFTVGGSSWAVGTNPAASGALRIPNNAWLAARNQANGGDVNMLRVNTSNQLEFGASFADLPLGSGDAVSMYNTTSGQLLRVTDGTAGTPDASANPLLKVERTLNIASASFTGDGAEACAAIVAITTGVATNDGQAVGVAGLAKSASTTVGSTGGDDACGLYGTGRITGSGTGVGLGGFVAGRRDTDTGKVTGLEVSCGNFTATPGTYNGTGFSQTTGIWLNANGNSDSGVGLSLGNAFGFQFAVGIGFPAQVIGGKTGGVATTSIRDDSSSSTSIAINGSHTNALVIASGAGKVIVGRTDIASQATDVLMQSTSDNNSALILFGKSATQAVNIFTVATSAGVELVSVGSTGNLRIIDTNIVLSATTGTKLGTATTQKLGLWNVTPVAQYNTTGTSTGFTAGAGTTATHLSTFTGNTGSSAYTMGDVVRALKLCGVMAA